MIYVKNFCLKDYHYFCHTLRIPFIPKLCSPFEIFINDLQDNSLMYNDMIVIDFTIRKLLMPSIRDSYNIKFHDGTISFNPKFLHR